MGVFGLTSLCYTTINLLYKMKTEFICVKPRSTIAQDRFDNDMDRLHSCRVVRREHGRVILNSISRRYAFEMFENGDDNWEVIK